MLSTISTNYLLNFSDVIEDELAIVSFLRSFITFQIAFRELPRLYVKLSLDDILDSYFFFKY